VASHAPYLQVVDSSSAIDINTIVSFAVFINPGDGRSRGLNLDECKALHRDMTLGESPRAMLGQPVKIADNGFTVLRIALGADIVMQALSCISSPQEMSRIWISIIDEDRRVLNKVAALAQKAEADIRRAAPAKYLHGFNIDTSLFIDAQYRAVPPKDVSGGYQHSFTSATEISLILQTLPAIPQGRTECSSAEMNM